MKKIALFDIDKTLIPYDSFFKWVSLILKRKKSGLLKLPKLALLGVTAIGSPEKLTRYKEKWLSLADGLSEKEMAELSKKLIAECIIPDLKPGVEAEIKQYKAAGYTIIFATASFTSVTLPNISMLITFSEQKLNLSAENGKSRDKTAKVKKKFAAFWKKFRNRK